MDPFLLVADELAGITERMRRMVTSEVRVVGGQAEGGGSSLLQNSTTVVLIQLCFVLVQCNINPESGQYAYWCTALLYSVGPVVC